MPKTHTPGLPSEAEFLEIMRTLVASGLMEEVKPGTFRLTPAGETYVDYMNAVDPAGWAFMKEMRRATPLVNPEESSDG
jgi:hypothetical protein